MQQTKNCVWLLQSLKSKHRILISLFDVTIDVFVFTLTSLPPNELPELYNGIVSFPLLYFILNELSTGSGWLQYDTQFKNMQ